MAAPVLGTVAEGISGGVSSKSLNVTVQPQGNNRRLLLGILLKDNTAGGADSVISSVVFDATGVNLSIGAGITLVATKYIDESPYSTRAYVYEILEADLPANTVDTAYAVDVTTAGSVQSFSMILEPWKDCDQGTIHQVLTDGTSANTSPAWDVLDSSVADCVAVDFISLGYSSTPTVTPLDGQTVAANPTGTGYGAGLSGWQTVALATTNIPHSWTVTNIVRHAWIGIVLAPVGGAPSPSSTELLTTVQTTDRGVSGARAARLGGELQ